MPAPSQDLRTASTRRKCARIRCRKHYEARRWWQRYCSARCRILAYEERHQEIPITDAPELREQLQRDGML
jgi:hypothetical protein